MEGRRMHNGGDGDVLSSQAPTAPGMALQCPGWEHSGAKATRSLFSVLVINDNHCGLTFLFEL
jgi:hypothetical protein